MRAKDQSLNNRIRLMDQTVYERVYGSVRYLAFDQIVGNWDQLIKWQTQTAVNRATQGMTSLGSRLDDAWIPGTG